MRRPIPFLRARRASGLSLVELLLALAIAALVMVPLLELLRTTAAASSHVAPRLALQSEADFAVKRIVAQIRNGTPNTSYTFDQATGSLTENQAGVPSTLAGSVTSFVQDMPPPETGQQLVKISLTLERGGASASAGATVRAEGMR